MKKTYRDLVILGAAATLFAFAGSAQAVVSGPCSDCHTMHNSQDGVANSLDGNTHGALTKDSCFGCHSQNTGNSGKFNDVGYPAVIVTNINKPTSYDNTLPGGFIISDTDATFDATRHNVLDVNDEDAVIYANIGFAPPGYDISGNTGATGLPTTTTWNEQLTCAGSFGCHGDHTIANQEDAIKGGHHGDDQLTGYRMLKGIFGKESIDYSVGNTADDNIYAGVDGNPDYTDKNTINYLCAECHGIFHSAANETPADNTGAWLRHPSDIKLPADGISGDKYSEVAPAADGSVPLGQIGFTGVNLPVGQTQPLAGAGIVLCISCHYSHGSANADILRWDYSTMQAGGASATDTGCFHCHTTKD
ncbi:MAG: hypothetical protein KAR13_06785 [Desulfobulbaceae bacterium]|nr:hypothetical protein [Desulfobulbaceae bacterium]